MIIVVVDEPSGLGSLTWDGLATIVAALLATGVAIWGYAHQQRLARRERRATMYSEALQAIEDYLESPYLVKRRDGSHAARMSVTTRISEIQSLLSYYSAMLATQAPKPISQAFDELVAQARRDAGPQLSAAWRGKPTRRDRKVPLGNRFDRVASDKAREAFLNTVARLDPQK